LTAGNNAGTARRIGGCAYPLALALLALRAGALLPRGAPRISVWWFISRGRHCFSSACVLRCASKSSARVDQESMGINKESEMKGISDRRYRRRAASA